jgi:sterol desaturase/sphingolipid hydroxylase (fatty acid hydroxylase superfamily)
MEFGARAALKLQPDRRHYATTHARHGRTIPMNPPATDIDAAQRGWTPEVPLRVPPLLEWPPRPLKILRYLFGFPGVYLPWAALFALMAYGLWNLLRATGSDLSEFSPRWILMLLGCNLAIAALFYGCWHLRLYGRRSQGNAFKYNPSWPNERVEHFLFRRPLASNVFWSICSGVPVWTGYLAITLWAQARGIAPTVTWSSAPAYSTILMLVLPFFHAVHFYFGHRMIHWAPLYNAVHYLHHANLNPGPWSGLAMHPVEHLVYFSGCLLFWIVPATPLHVIYFTTLVGLAPAEGHCGFGKMVVGGARLTTDNFYHYLHHKHFRVNFGDALLIPIDRFFGTFHDGIRRVPRRRRDA